MTSENLIIRNQKWKDLLTQSLIEPTELPDHLKSDRVPVKLDAQSFAMRINPYVLSLIQSHDDPIGRQVIPHAAEFEMNDGLLDPLAEEDQSPVSAVIHRYPRRVVFLVSNQCAVHCRFCMRKRRVGSAGKIDAKAIQQGLDYIAGHAQINEIILSGGDPLMLSDDRLCAILATLRRMQHVKILRLHTRMPCFLPQRIDEQLSGRLADFKPLYVNIHFNHPREITAEAAAACALLADAGIPLGSQTVLLKDVNDDAVVLRALMARLLEIRVRPYYIHQLDRVPGATRFWVPLEKGLAIMAALQGQLSGLAVPRFMVDLPGGGGKVTLTSDAVVHKEKNHWLLRNWQGQLCAYPLTV